MGTLGNGVTAGRRRIADVVGAAAATLAVAGIVLNIVAFRLPYPQGAWGARYSDVVVLLGLVAIGWLLAHRRPDNAVSWILLGAGAAAGVNSFGNGYAVAANGWGWAGGAWGALAVEVSWVPLVMGMFWAIGRFPDGRRTGGIGGAIDVVAIGATGVIVLAEVLGSRLDNVEFYTNPLWFADATFDPLFDIATQAFPVVLVVAVGAVVHRFRRAQGTERQQLRWVVVGTAFAAAVNILVVLPLLTAGDGWGIVGTFASTASMLGFTAVLASIAVAILRYRLYDLDRLVSRTLAYVALTGILLGVYAAGVLGLGAVVRGVGGGEPGPVVVAVSTLIAFALFDPVRRRVQDVIDRRLYRSRYDARRTIEWFERRLRDEVDIATVSLEIEDVVVGALRPASIALWVEHEGVSA